MAEEIINKIALSGLITIDLENFYPKDDYTVIDLKDFLFMGQILKEKHFREQLAEKDWSEFSDKAVIITLSTDALIPNWAYMLLISKLQPVASEIFIGNLNQYLERKLLSNIEQQVLAEDYIDSKIVIKGCGDKEVGASAYAKVTEILLPVAKSIMYGEPCSTVPVYKKR